MPMIMMSAFVVRWVTYDTACNSRTAIGNAVKLLFENRVDVFIGPACSVGTISDKMLKKYTGDHLHCGYA